MPPLVPRPKQLTRLTYISIWRFLFLYDQSPGSKYLMFQSQRLRTFATGSSVSILGLNQTQNFWKMLSTSSRESETSRDSRSASIHQQQRKSLQGLPPVHHRVRFNIVLRQKILARIGRTCAVNFAYRHMCNVPRRFRTNQAIMFHTSHYLFKIFLASKS